MITLDYAVRTAPSSTADLSNVDENALHYELFLGDVTFKVDEADMSAPWGWVPVIDFAVCADRIINDLESGKADSFEFTESESRIDFRREGDEIVVQTSYGAPEARAPRDELREATRLFLAGMLDNLIREHPSLAQNRHIRSIYPKGLVADKHLVKG